MHKIKIHLVLNLTVLISQMLVVSHLRADVIPPPPEGCPPGWINEPRGHGMYTCSGTECVDDSDCSIGTECQPALFFATKQTDGTVIFRGLCTDSSQSGCIEVRVCVEADPIKNPRDSGDTPRDAAAISDSNTNRPNDASPASLNPDSAVDNQVKSSDTQGSIDSSTETTSADISVNQADGDKARRSGCSCRMLGRNGRSNGWYWLAVGCLLALSYGRRRRTSKPAGS